VPIQRENPLAERADYSTEQRKTNPLADDRQEETAMNVLVTAGNTQVMIDRVRCLTNVFSGRTGAGIARHFHAAGHAVTLLTSHPELTRDLMTESYRTYDDLAALMESKLRTGGFDVLVHCAAVSDYLYGGVFASVDGRMVDRAAGKVKSDEPELWLRLVRAPKLVDRVRSEWGFRGVLVKFKLEVGVTESDLRDIAERSRIKSGADLMVANTLEGSAEWAIIGPGYERIDRAALPSRLLAEVERVHAEKS